MAAPAAPRIVPIPAEDPLFAETLRAALESYIRGDYRKASDYFLDAAAVARPHGHVTFMWRQLGNDVHALLGMKGVVNVDSAVPADTLVRR